MEDSSKKALILFNSANLAQEEHRVGKVWMRSSSQACKGRFLCARNGEFLRVERNQHLLCRRVPLQKLSYAV